ncbi:hypothetical protein FOCC_FOCC017727, partial [Frankliniella occidentalis]
MQFQRYIGAKYRDNGEEKCISFVVISDTEDHRNEEVYAFQQTYVPFLKQHIPHLKHIYYFSDGAASQYKNRKNVANLRMHFNDFGLTAEWHYFATSHGKGPCDGVGGTLKRHAARESLHRVKNKEPISDAAQFFKWAEVKFKETVHVAFITANDIKEVTEVNKERISACPAVDGIKSSHAVVPLSPNTVFLKQYSSSETGFYMYFGPKDEVNYPDIHGFVTLHHDNNWCVGLVEEKIESELK